MKVRVAAAALVMLPAIAAARPPFPSTPAPEGGGDIGALWRAVAAAFDEASLARIPPPQPPVPVRVTWKARRVASLDLGAPLLALAAGDLDGDGKAELVALTEKHVVVLRPAKKTLAEVARAALPPEPAPIRPRDAVGTLVIAPGAVAGGPAVEVRARASTRGRGGRWALEGKALRELGPWADFPLCADVSAALEPGRNYFAAEVPYYATRCRDDVVDRGGRPVRAQITVSTRGEASVGVETRCTARDAGCVPRRDVELGGIGTAVELDDVDRDGTLEIITAGAGAPGDADALAVWNLGDGGVGKKPVFRRGFSGGVVGVCSGDVDGDGDRDVFAAVRLAGARKVDVWQVN